MNVFDAHEDDNKNGTEETAKNAISPVLIVYDNSFTITFCILNANADKMAYTTPLFI